MFVGVDLDRGLSQGKTLNHACVLGVCALLGVVLLFVEWRRCLLSSPNLHCTSGQCPSNKCYSIAVSSLPCSLLCCPPCCLLFPYTPSPSHLSPVPSSAAHPSVPHYPTPTLSPPPPPRTRSHPRSIRGEVYIRRLALVQIHSPVFNRQWAHSGFFIF